MAEQNQNSQNFYANYFAMNPPQYQNPSNGNYTPMGYQVRPNTPDITTFQSPYAMYYQPQQNYAANSYDSHIVSQIPAVVDPLHGLASVSNSEGKWTEDLKDYVRRAYDDMHDDEERNQMDRILKQKLEYVFSNNVSLDWKNEPIPKIPIRTFRTQSTVNPIRPSFVIARARGRGLQTGMINRQNVFSRLNAQKTANVPGNNQSVDLKSGSDMSCSDNEAPEEPINKTNLSESSFSNPKRSKKQKEKTVKMKFNGVSLGDSGSERKINMRANRFKQHLEESKSQISYGSIAKSTSALITNMNNPESDEITALNLQQFRIFGTMEDLEKPYLRLTRAPESHEVRPLRVLKLTLEHLNNKWEENKDYKFICEQFKSLRQDLTVQCIEEDFTALVYETHCDIALEVGDFEEFHQCQSQLMRLHRYGFGKQRELEFTAYRLLYYIFTLDYLGMSMILASLRKSHRENHMISYSLAVRRAWADGNYRRFFKLYSSQDSPGKCKLVINWSIDRERRETTKKIFRAYRPSTTLSCIATSLGYINEENNMSQEEQCIEYLKEAFKLEPSQLSEWDKIDCKSLWPLITEQT